MKMLKHSLFALAITPTLATSLFADDAKESSRFVARTGHILAGSGKMLVSAAQLASAGMLIFGLYTMSLPALTTNEEKVINGLRDNFYRANPSLPMNSQGVRARDSYVSVSLPDALLVAEKKKELAIVEFLIALGIATGIVQLAINFGKSGWESFVKAFETVKPATTEETE